MVDAVQIQKLLEGVLKIERVIIQDESQKHADHNPHAKKGGTHFDVIVISDDFKGLSSVRRHRIVHQALLAAFQDGMHALALKTYTVEEFEIEN